MIKKKKKLKKFPTGENWKFVLLEILKNSPQNYSEPHKMRFKDTKHPLAQKLKIKGEELMLAILFLKNNKLIKYTNQLRPLDDPNINSNWYNTIILTEKGFNVGFKLENEISNSKIQKTLVIFTTIIALTTVATFIKDLFNPSPDIFLFIYIILLCILIISFFGKDLISKIKKLF